MKDASDSANTTLANMINALREANTGAQTLIGETANEAKINARALVGEAMAECERLLRTSGELSAQASEIRTTLAKTAEAGASLPHGDVEARGNGPAPSNRRNSHDHSADDRIRRLR